VTKLMALNLSSKVQRSGKTHAEWAPTIVIPMEFKGLHLYLGPTNLWLSTLI